MYDSQYKLTRLEEAQQLAELVAGILHHVINEVNSPSVFSVILELVNMSFVVHVITLINMFFNYF